MFRTLRVLALFASAALGSLSLAAAPAETGIPVYIVAAGQINGGYAGGGMGFNLNAQNAQGVVTVIGSAGGGGGPGAYTQTNVCVARLQPGKTSTVHFTTTNFASSAIQFLAGSGAAIESRKVSLGGEFVPVMRYAQTGSSGSVTVDYEIRLMDTSQLQSARLGVAAPLVNERVLWRVSLGSNKEGTSAGWLSLMDQGSQSDWSFLYSPQTLVAPSNIVGTKYWTNGSNLCQALSEEGLVRVTSTSVTSYTVDVYPRAQATGSGFPYGATGVPIISYLVEKHPSFAKGLKITGTWSDGSARVTELSYDTGTWTTKGSIAASASPANAQIDSSTGGVVANVGDEATRMTTISETGTTGPAGSTQETVHLYPWGPETTSATGAPNTGAPTTINVDYGQSNGAPGAYAKPGTISNNAGGWVTYQYYGDFNRLGQVYRVFHPFQNSPASTNTDPTLGDVTTYDYTTDLQGVARLPSLMERRINNTVIGKTTWSYVWPTADLGGGVIASLVQSTQTAYSDATHSLTTIAKSFRGDVPVSGFDYRLGGRPYSVQGADGVKTSYAYFLGAFGFGSAGDPDFKTVTIHGTTQPAGADNLSAWDGRPIDSLYVIANKSTADVSIFDQFGRLRRMETYAYIGGGTWTVMGQMNYEVDPAGRVTQVTDLRGQVLSTSNYNGPFLHSTTDATGIETVYTYYDDGRVKTSTKKGASAWGSNPAQNDLTTKFEYNPLGQLAKKIVGDGLPETLVSVWGYDAAGRLTSAKAPGIANSTIYTYGATDQEVTVTYPNGAWTKKNYYDDGRLKEITGTAQPYQSWGYWISGDRVCAQRTIAESGCWTNYNYDWLGRQLEEWRPTAGAPAHFVYYDYNNKGQLWRVRQPLVANVLIEYDSLGQEVRTGLDRNNNDALDVWSTDRISARENKIVNRSGAYWTESHQWVYDADNSDHSIGAYSYSKLTGLAANRLAEYLSIDVNGNEAGSWVDVDRSNKRLTQVSDVPSSSQQAKSYILNGLPVESFSSTGVHRHARYDDLTRPFQSEERSGGWSSVEYVFGSTLVWRRKDANNTVLAQFGYNDSGQVNFSTNALGKSTRTSYTAQGQVFRTWGDVPNPIEYEYDAWGQKKFMRAYRSTSANWVGSDWPSNPGDADTTTWNYDHDSRMLTSKTDAAGRAVAYIYNQAQQLYQRVSPRHKFENPADDFIRITYGYDDTGTLGSTDYNDATPDVTYTYKRAGMVDTVTDATGSRNFTYRTQDGQIDFEQLSSFYGDRRVSHWYDDAPNVKGRYNRLLLGNSGNPMADAQTYYGYIDNRVTWVDNNTAGVDGRGFNLGYASNSDLLQQVWQGNASYSVWRGYEANRDVVSTVENWEGGTLRAKFGYARNSAGQVTSVTKTGEIFNVYGSGQGIHTRYGYTDRGELGYEESFLADPSNPGNSAQDIGAVYGRRLGLGYDSQGNRTGQDRNGEYVSYGQNNLNQITSRGAPGTINVTGAATAGDAVQVNGQAANRQGQYFQKSVSVDNAGTPHYQPVRATVGSDLETAQAAITPSYVARANETLDYDEEGNTKQDDRWIYRYDAENRIAQMETGSAAIAVGAPHQRLTFTYDYAGRRVRKQVEHLEAQGFLGQYFDSANFGDRHHVRTDGQISFNLSGSFPGNGQDGNDFSAHWSGYLFPTTGGNYRFRFTVDDMFRLWVNGQLVAKSWHGQGATPYETADIYLPGGQAALVQVEFYQGWGGADAWLDWKGADTGNNWTAVPAAKVKSTDLAGSGVWRSVTDNKFIYDGWNLVLELNNIGTLSVQRAYTWGLDLSSTAQGAGGIGGLLKIDEGNQTYLPVYDEKGHVLGLVRASDHQMVATYEYNAFGEVVRQSGEYAARNPIGWATKYVDRETGLVYFGRRFYSPYLGRFICRDPKEELDGANLHAFVHNDPVNRWDFLGMLGDGGYAGSGGFFSCGYNQYWDNVWANEWRAAGERIWNEGAKTSNATKPTPGAPQVTVDSNSRAIDYTNPALRPPQISTPRVTDVSMYNVTGPAQPNQLYVLANTSVLNPVFDEMLTGPLISVAFAADGLSQPAGSSALDPLGLPSDSRDEGPVVAVDTPRGGNLSFLAGWFAGVLEPNIVYGEDSKQTNDMRQSPGAEVMRDRFYGNGAQTTRNIDYGTGRAAWETIVLSPLSWSSTALQVGGFGQASVVNNGDGTATFNITNVAGTHSFFYHILDDRSSPTGPMHNVTQTFVWTEQIEYSDPDWTDEEWWTPTP